MSRFDFKLMGCTTAVFILWAMACRPAMAHPMGNFSISHYSRITAEKDAVRVHYLLDFAEIPTVSEMDKNGDGQVSVTERDNFLQQNTDKLGEGLMLQVNGQRVPLTVQEKHVSTRPGAGGLATMLLQLDLTAKLPLMEKGSALNLVYRDGNYPERTGWKEIVVTAGTDAAISNTTAPTKDISSELTRYPSDAGVVPPSQTEASFTLSPGTGAVSTVSNSQTASSDAVNSSRTPQDAFTQAIAHQKLTVGVVLSSLMLAFVFGAFHALSPGHGKAMVAAYLVGARGTAKHALFLGGVVTLTHTIGVFALGLLTLAAAQYVVPEKLYPILSALSGVAIVCIGVTLFRSRLLAMMAASHSGAGHHHDHSHDHAHDHSHHHDDEHAHDHGHYHEEGHSHDHTHDHHTHTHEMHDHSHDHAHDHSHGAGWHDHGDGHYHSHDLPEDAPLTLKSLLVLGVTGGALPCPSALVVMLSAIALHRIGFGLALITAFSLGLAAVLVGIGMLVVYARGFMEKMPLSGKLMYRLPVFSAAVVTIIGVVLVIKAVGGGF